MIPVRRQVGHNRNFGLIGPERHHAAGLFTSAFPIPAFPCPRASTTADRSSSLFSLAKRRINSWKTPHAVVVETRMAQPAVGVHKPDPDSG